jgi:hypothetical protein
LVECQLPKLDVAGSSPVARSLEVLWFQPPTVAGIPTGPGEFFLGPVLEPVGSLIFAANEVCCSGVSAGESASRLTDGFALFVGQPSCAELRRRVEHLKRDLETYDRVAELSREHHVARIEADAARSRSAQVDVAS